MIGNQIVQVFDFEYWIRKENMTVQLRRWLSRCSADISWEIWTYVYLILIGNKWQTKIIIWSKTNLVGQWFYWDSLQKCVWRVTYGIRYDTKAASSLKGPPKHRDDSGKLQPMSLPHDSKAARMGREFLLGSSAY